MICYWSVCCGSHIYIAVTSWTNRSGQGYGISLLDIMHRFLCPQPPHTPPTHNPRHPSSSSSHSNPPAPPINTPLLSSTLSLTFLQTLIFYRMVYIVPYDDTSVICLCFDNIILIYFLISVPEVWLVPGANGRQSIGIKAIRRWIGELVNWCHPSLICATNLVSIWCSHSPGIWCEAK